MMVLKFLFRVSVVSLPTDRPNPNRMGEAMPAKAKVRAGRQD
jgi:hypothetical protein